MDAGRPGCRRQHDRAGEIVPYAPLSSPTVPGYGCVGRLDGASGTLLHHVLHGRRRLQVGNNMLVPPFLLMTLVGSEGSFLGVVPVGSMVISLSEACREWGFSCRRRPLLYMYGL